MALTLPKSYAQDVTQPIKVRNGGELVFTGNSDVDTISVALYNGGAEYEPGGSVTLNCIRADGVTMVVSGAVSGNVASATLTQACCAVPGMMTVVMQLTSGGTGAIFAAVYNVLPSSTDTVGDAGTIIEDVAALIADIDAAVASIPPTWTELSGEVSELKNELANTEADIYEPYSPSNPDYVTGNFSSATGAITAQKRAVLTRSFIQTKFGSEISADAGYQIKVAIYSAADESTFQRYIGWTEEPVIIPDNCYIRVAVSNVENYGETLDNTAYAEYINWSLKKIKRTDLSDFNNDVGYITADSVPQFSRTANLFNSSDPDVVVGSINQSNGTVRTSSTDFRTSGFIPVASGLNYIGNFTNHLAWYNANKEFISASNQVYSDTAPENATYARVDIDIRVIDINSVMFVQSDTLPTEYVPYYDANFVLPLDHIEGLSYAVLQPWAQKNLLVYGDSITAQINGDDPKSWGQFVYDALDLAGIHGRGVGGQTYFWNTNTFQVDADGNYVDRGTGADNCLGCFASWQRISSMIPDALKDTLDVVVIMGGTNDIGNVEEATGTGSIEWTEPVWSSVNNTDTDWISATDYNGGDYDVATFTGAVASTIMKIQTRCPNAKIILASPLSRWNMTDHTPYTSMSDVTMQEMAEILHKVANYMSVPFIDVTALCGINGWNYATYIADGVHPNTAGRHRIASAIISGMTTIYPNV